jgi:hypothetical protein
MAQPPKIDEEERRARQQAVEYAQASVALEGFETSEQSKAWAQRFIDGEIDLDVYLSASFDDVHGV